MSWVIGNSSPTAKSVRLMSTQARTHNGTIITLSTGANDGGENHNDGDEGLTSICARSYHVWIRTRWGDFREGQSSNEPFYAVQHEAYHKQFNNKNTTAKRSSDSNNTDPKTSSALFSCDDDDPRVGSWTVRNQ